MEQDYGVSRATVDDFLEAPILGAPIPGAPQLRPYQVDALNAVSTALSKKQNRVLVKMPTGTGKTVLFAEMPKWSTIVRYLSAFPRRGASMLVIAHREELLDQAADKIRRQNPGAMVAVEQGDRYAPNGCDVVVASIQTLSAMKFRRLHHLLRFNTFRLVIVDEAHHSAASTYRTALVHLGFLPPAEASDTANIEAADYDDVAKMEEALRGWDAKAPMDRLLVGVTATPNRSDAIGLGCVFQSIVYNYALKQAITDGFLVPIVPWVIETDTSLDDVRLSRGDFNQKDLAEAVNQEKRNELAVAAWMERAKGLPTIAFTVDVAHAHDLAMTFRNHGVRAVPVSGETPKDERRDILRQYQERRIDVITNCMVLTEGTDLPLTECILHAKPTKSATLYEQMTGRGLRLSPGKSQCIVIDLVDVARRHSLQASPVLYGLPPGLKVNGDDLRKVEGEIEALREKHPGFDIDKAMNGGHLTLKQLAAKATTFDIWTIPAIDPNVKAAISMNWIKVTDDVYRLSYPWGDGHEILMVQRDLVGKWDVSCTLRPHGRPGEAPGQTRQRTLAASVNTEIEGLRLAEAFIDAERRKISGMKDASAPWRTRPPSRKQVEFAQRLGIPVKSGMTAGQVSDLIDMAKARRAR